MNESNDFSTSVLLEKLLDKFESQWRSGTRAKLEDFLSQAPAPNRDAFLKNLLHIELEHRIQRGELPEYSEYLPRLPDKSDLIDLTFREAAASLGRWWPPNVTRLKSIGLLAFGGQGEVWLAIDPQTDRHVALKVVKPSLKGSESTLHKFRREAEINAKLEHPNVVPVYEITRELSASGKPDPSSPCFVMRVYGDHRLHVAIAAFHARARSKASQQLLDALRVFEKVRSTCNRNALLLELAGFEFDEHEACDRLLRTSIQAILNEDSDAGSLRKAITKFHENDWSESEFRKLLSRFQKVCDAVAFAHDRGIIHRDLKPENVMLGEFGETLVADWGLAKMVVQNSESTAADPLNSLNIMADSEQTPTGAGVISGTPPYMSPEQADGRANELGPATDIYSLGATLFCILTGQAPIGAKPSQPSDSVCEATRLSDDVILKRVRFGDFLRPKQVEPRTPMPLDAIVVKAMSIEPSDRYTTALELAEDVQKWLDDEPVSIWPEPIVVRTKRWMKVHQTAVTAISAAIFALLLALSVTLGIVIDAKNKTGSALQLAKNNANTATEQAGLALNTLQSVIFDLQRSLINVPGGAIVRRRLIASVMPQLDKVATEFASKSMVERTTMIAMGAMGDTILQLGQNGEGDGNPQNPLLSPTPEMSAVNIVERMYRRALEMAQELANADPDNRQAQRDLSVSMENIGDVKVRLGSLKEALTTYQASFDIRWILFRADPHDVETRRDLSVSHDKIGGVLLNLGQTTEPLKRFKDGLEIRRTLAGEFPNDCRIQRDLAISFDRIGGVLLRMGQTEESLAMYEAAFSERSKLAEKNRDDVQAQQDLSVSCNALGPVLLQLGRVDDALVKYDQGLRIRRMLVKDDPTNVQKQRDLSVSLGRVADVFLKTGKPVESLPMCEEALKIKRSLAETDPDDTQKQRDLVVGLVQFGSVGMKLERNDEAKIAFEDALGIGRTQAEKDPDDVEKQRDLSLLYDRLGELLMKSGNILDALTRYEEGLKIRRVLSDADQADAESQRGLHIGLFNVGDAMLQLGRTEDGLSRLNEGIKIRIALHEVDLNNSQKQRDLSVGYNRIGDALLTLDRIDDAFVQYRDSLILIRPLAKAAPNDMQIQQDLFVTCIRIGDVLHKLDRIDEAISHFEDSMSPCRILAASDPANALRQYDIMAVHSKIGDAHVLQGKFDIAQDDFRKGIAVLDKMVEAGQSVSSSQQAKAVLEQQLQSCAEILAVISDWDKLLKEDVPLIPDLLAFRMSYFARLGRLREVVQAGEKLRELEPKSEKNLYNAACAFSLCADLCVRDKPQPSDADLVEQKKYLDLSITCLKEAIAAGFDDFDIILQDPDLTALHERKEFKALYYKVKD